MKAARVLFTPELLVDLLNFPDGATITGASMVGGNVELTVEHDGLKDVDVPPGADLPIACPTFRFTTSRSVAFDAWNQ
jgi:hypothetical protein